MTNSFNQINEIREKADIVSIISSYISITKKGKNYFAVCPFHDDHNPSMSISPEKQIYKCFVCGASGNVFSFVKDYENVSFMEAVSIVAKNIGLTFNNTYKKNKIKDDKEHILLEFVCKYYINNLNTTFGKKALKYLKDRNLTEKTIDNFKIGLSLPSKDNLVNILQKKGYEKSFLNELGLMTNDYDYFQNRIMFPLFDEDGQVIGFSARIYNDEKNQAKYINSKESKIFKKGEFLYNYHIAKKEVKKSKKLIIVEGQMDVIRLCENDINYCVALSGTALTNNQVDLIKKLRVPVYLLLDNDFAGEKATYSNGEILEKANIDVKIVRITDFKDPDEFITKKGKEEFLNYLKKPMSYLSFKINYLKNNKNLSETKDLVKYINEVLDSLKNEKDDITIEVVLKKLSKDYDLDYKTLFKKLNNQKDNKITKMIKTNNKESEKHKKSKDILASEAIIYFMMQDSIYIKMYQKKLGYLPLKKHRSIVNDIIYFYEINGFINMADFITFSLEKEINADIVLEIIKENDKIFVSPKEMENYIEVIENYLVKEKIQRLKKELKEENNEMKKIEIVKEITKLKKEV